MDVPDIAAISKVAKKHSVPLIVDSTVTTPYLLKAKDLGADIVIHSTSKFINGHGNSIGGVLVDCGTFNWAAERFPHLKEYYGKYGPLAFFAKVRRGVFRDFGASVIRAKCFLINVFLKDIPQNVRVNLVILPARGIVKVP